MKEVKQAPVITPPKDMTNLECIDEGLKGLSDYFNAALEGGESKAALRRMWDQQMGILAVLLKNHQNEPALSGVKNALAEYQAYEKGFSDGKKEHDAALIAKAREKWEREKEEEYLLNEGGFVKCDPSNEPCEECGKNGVQHFTHISPDSGECDSWRCSDCAKKWIDEDNARMRRNIEYAEAERLKEVKAQAREDVMGKISTFEDCLLKEMEAVRQIEGDDNNRVPFDTILKKVESQLESLRSEVGK